MTPEEIFNAAQVAGDIATRDGQDGYPCGFAWIVIKPARGRFVKFLKDKGIGRTGVYGGYQVSSYEACSFKGQNMHVKENGCQAFADILNANGINAHVETRLD